MGDSGSGEAPRARPGAERGNLLYGPQPDVAGAAGYQDTPPRMGFFTDTSVCIGCKACEVACKEWNAIPEDGLELTGMMYDNTEELSADTWLHVAFIEQPRQLGHQQAGVQRAQAQVSSNPGMPEKRPAETALTSLP